MTAIATPSTTATSTPVATPITSGAVRGTPRRWLQLEGLAMFVAGALVFVVNGGPVLLLLPLLLAPDLSAIGYLAGPKVGAMAYNLAHTWAPGVAVLGIGLALGVPAIVLAGAVLVAHTGMDRAAGYGLKYATAFGDTHMGWIGRRPSPAPAA
ncbi:MAG TPA: DUF4260 domain-containing protein [Candidatus Limnocylindrales bacterium]|nr:DUF4260 domain-containing protein [Candidatus Limnocylindrales bacterium]